MSPMVPPPKKLRETLSKKQSLSPNTPYT